MNNRQAKIEALRYTSALLIGTPGSVDIFIHFDGKDEQKIFDALKELACSLEIRADKLEQI